mgnify:CR=1 FL=1|tara:strand:- start:4441 stop:5265 length:825 start_codon:yes stop_codon:yes gene_type:complete
MGAVTRLVRPDNRRHQLVTAALAPDILLGMPHLTPSGLSETWLLKELAHRHWLMLGRIMGLDDADFRTSDGGEVYAAICATALSGWGPSAVRANDILTIDSSLAPASRTRMTSRHQLSIDGRFLGEVELLSAFVHRANGAIARVRHPAFEHAVTTFAKSPLADRASLVRRGDLTAAGLPGRTGAAQHRHVFTPSQLQDFNGASLFYFANYQSVIDRAMETWFGCAAPMANKQTYYVGNIAAGESIVVKHLGGPGHCLRMERSSGQPIAYQICLP